MTETDLSFASNFRRSVLIEYDQLKPKSFEKLISLVNRELLVSLWHFYRSAALLTPVPGRSDGTALRHAKNA